MSSLLITFVMTGVIWLFVAVRAVESIVNRGLSVKLFLLLTSFTNSQFFNPNITDIAIYRRAVCLHPS